MSEEQRSTELSPGEQREAEDRKHPRTQVLYEAVRLEGEHELERPAAALAWSGLAAGLSMGFSRVAMGILTAALPREPWTKLLVSFGYSVGFLIIIVARQQLFTENSLTPVIVLLQKKDYETAVKVLRLWLIVAQPTNFLSIQLRQACTNSNSTGTSTLIDDCIGARCERSGV